MHLVIVNELRSLNYGALDYDTYLSCGGNTTAFFSRNVILQVLQQLLLYIISCITI
jgi:hypothetical protein